MAEKGEDPYTDADFERLLELEKEDAAKGNWTEAKRSPDANVWRKKDPNHDIHLLKVWKSLDKIALVSVSTFNSNKLVNKLEPEPSG